MGLKGYRILRGLSSADLVFVGIILGFLGAHLAGLSYVAGARSVNEKVFGAYREEMAAQLSEMPVSAQLIASFASRRAMETALAKNREGSVMDLVFRISSPGRDVWTMDGEIDGRGP